MQPTATRPGDGRFPLGLRLLLAAALTVLTAPLAHAALVHSYTFEGNAQDQTGTADGTVTGATLTTDRFGNPNGAYFFSGNGDAIQMNLTNGNTVTYAVWARLSTTPTHKTFMLFNTGPSGSGPDLYFVEPGVCSAGHPGGVYWNTWDSCNSPLLEPYPSAATDGQFHLFAVVVDAAAATTSLYIDGALAGSGVYRTPGTLFTAGNSAPGESSWSWQGEIDDIYVYDQALGAAEIAALYSNTSVADVAVPEPGTLGLLAMALGAIAGRRRRRGS